MSIVQLFVAIGLIGLAVWVVYQTPIDTSFKKIVLVIGVVAAILISLWTFGLLPPGLNQPIHR